MKVTTSDSEDYIYSWLVDKFGEKNIERQRKEKFDNDTRSFRLIDFYIKSYDIYLEYEGCNNIEHIRKNYNEKKKLYKKNQKDCIHILPEHVGMLKFIFERQFLRILQKRKSKFKILKYALKENKRYVFFMLLFLYLIIKNLYTAKLIESIIGLLIIFYVSFEELKDYYVKDDRFHFNKDI